MIVMYMHNVVINTGHMHAKRHILALMRTFLRQQIKYIIK